MGDFDQQPPSARQIAATQALIAYLSKRYNIAPSGVRTHAHLAATKTVCPGKYFPSEAMLMRDQRRACPSGPSAPPGRSSATRRSDNDRSTLSRSGPPSGQRSTSPQGSGLPLTLVTPTCILAAVERPRAREPSR